jgi:CRP-like cAMP-binding protein
MLPVFRVWVLAAWPPSFDECPARRESSMADESLTTEKVGNLLLDSMGDDARASLVADSRRTPIEVGRVLFRPGEEITYVAFPLSGTLSMLARPDDDDMPVEAATIGSEGAASLHSALGSRTASQELVGRADGEMFEVPIQTFTKHVEQDRFRDLVFGYLEALVVQISLAAACNAVHQVNQRCARWLLQIHDRVQGDTFGLTQEYLGIMLGVERPSVSLAQRALSDAGCITFTGDSITVVDREGLEDAACPCYEKIRTEYSRLVPLRDRR